MIEKETSFVSYFSIFESPVFSVQIPTDEKNPEEIVEEILTWINASLP